MVGMAWFPRSVDHGDEHFAYLPSGGNGKLIALGVLLPITIIAYATRCWIVEEALWLGRRGQDITVTGDTARATAATVFFVGLFCHFRWFWGILPRYRVYEVGTILSMTGVIIAGAVSFYYLLRFGS